MMVALEAFRQAFGELDCLHEEQLSGGGLDAHQVLVLCGIHLLRRADAETIRDWVQAGGSLVMDEVPALDEAKQPPGVFAPLMDVEGTAEVQEAPVSVPGTGFGLSGQRSYLENRQAKLLPCHQEQLDREARSS